MSKVYIIRMFDIACFKESIINVAFTSKKRADRYCRVNRKEDILLIWEELTLNTEEK